MRDKLAHERLDELERRVSFLESDVRYGPLDKRIFSLEELPHIHQVLSLIMDHLGLEVEQGGLRLVKKEEKEGEKSGRVELP